MKLVPLFSLGNSDFVYIEIPITARINLDSFETFQKDLLLGTRRSVTLGRMKAVRLLFSVGKESRHWAD